MRQLAAVVEGEEGRHRHGVRRHGGHAQHDQEERNQIARGNVSAKVGLTEGFFRSLDSAIT